MIAFIKVKGCYTEEGQKFLSIPKYKYEILDLCPWTTISIWRLRKKNPNNNSSWTEALITRELISSSLLDVFKRRRGSNFALIWITPWPIGWVNTKGPFLILWTYESLQTNSKAIRTINGLYSFAEPQNAGTTLHMLYRQRNGGGGLWVI